MTNTTLRTNARQLFAHLKGVQAFAPPVGFAGTHADEFTPRRRMGRIIVHGTLST